MKDTRRGMDFPEEVAMDRRINDRHAIQVKTILSFADTPAKECRTLNVSGGGAFIMTSKPKPVGSKLYMSFLMDAKPNDQIRKKTVMPESELLSLPEITIVTQGEQGSTIHAEGRVLHIPIVPPEPLREPTGAGDAYRGGIIKGMLRGYPWEVTGRIAALAATYVLEQDGTQNHHYTLGEFAERYRQAFGETPELVPLQV